jgi:hypothetical protein
VGQANNVHEPDGPVASVADARTFSPAVPQLVKIKLRPGELIALGVENGLTP